MLIVLFSLVGLMISVYDVRHPWGEEGAFCDFNSAWSCSIVNTCKWARLFGIKIAAFGVAGYLFLFAGATYTLGTGLNPLVRRLMFLAAGAASLFSLYLTGIEAFILHVFCPTCLISQALILLILVGTWFLYTKAERTELVKKASTVSGAVIVVSFIIGVPLATHLLYSICFTIHDHDTPVVPLGNLDDFAKCLTESGAMMYGKYNCGYCLEQKESFGESWQYMNYVECGIEGQPYFQVEECRHARIEGYPTWRFADGSEVLGAPSFIILAAKTGCDLPAAEDV